MTALLRSVLDFIYRLVGNYGWSIALFTILIRMVLLPLDIKNRKGMIQMQKMQPKINQLQKKYANDQQKLQQKQMELFRNEHYNPMSGCLPMLIQIPILWIMFAAMRSLANEQMVRQIIEYVCGNTPNLSGWLWIKNVWAADSPFSAVVPTLQNLQMVPADVWNTVIQSLPQETIELLISKIPNYTDGMLAVASNTDVQTLAKALYDIAALQPAYQAAMETSISGLTIIFFSVDVYKQYNGLLILPVLAAVTQVIMTKYSSQPSANDGKNDQNPQSQSMNAMMKYMFPLMSVYFCLISSASFAIYWVTSNIVAGISNYAISQYFQSRDEQPAQDQGVLKA